MMIETASAFSLPDQSRDSVATIESTLIGIGLAMKSACAGVQHVGYRLPGVRKRTMWDNTHIATAYRGHILD